MCERNCIKWPFFPRRRRDNFRSHGRCLREDDSWSGQRPVIGSGGGEEDCAGTHPGQVHVLRRDPPPRSLPWRLKQEDDDRGAKSHPEVKRRQVCWSPFTLGDTFKKNCICTFSFPFFQILCWQRASDEVWYGGWQRSCPCCRRSLCPSC